MHSRTTRSLLAALVAGVLLLSACGSDGDSDSSSTTTTEASTDGAATDPTASTGEPDEDYCRVARRTQGVASSDYEAVLQEQLDAAPPELEDPLQALVDNVEILSAADSSVEDRAKIADPLASVMLYQFQQCGIALDLFGGG